MTKVLFVEERADLRAFIRDALSEIGYEVQTLAAEAEGLSVCGLEQPDLVIYGRDSLTRGYVGVLDRIVCRLTRDGKDPVIVLCEDGEADLPVGRCALRLPTPLDIDALIVAAAGLLSGELAGPGAALN